MNLLLLGFWHQVICMQVDEIPTVEPEPKLEKRDEHPSPLVGFAPVTADC